MMNHAKVFKKTAPNGKLTVYVERRELWIKDDGIQALHGVLFVDANYVKERKVFGQFVLTFRYGREDEEVMGLRFCNEACLQAEQLWPRQNPDEPYKNLTPLQDTLVKRLGAGAVPFSFTVSSLAPPSVTLLPARSYAGAPIGTNYDLRVFVGENPEDKPHKRSSIRMGMKLYQCAPSTDRSQPYAAFSKQLLLADGHVEVEATLDKEVYERGENINVNVSVTNHSSRNVRRIKMSNGISGENPEDKPHKRSSIRMGMKLYQCAPSTDRSQPYAAFSKQLLLADGHVEVEATLDKEVYERGENINVNVSVTNHSSRNVRRIKILAVQYVDVAMFSNGKFKNVVAMIDTTEGCPVSSGSSLKRQFQLTPARGAIKNWIALEEFYDRESALASTVARNDPQEKNVFAIYVSYYIKVKLFTSAIGGEVSVKVPFKLMRLQPVETDTPTNVLPEAPTNGAAITTSQSMFDLTSTDHRRGSTKTRRSPPSRSTSEDSVRCSESHSAADAERFRESLQLEGRGRGRLVNTAS
ncbi:arrestin homolog [Penaeus chinensis]|uniref:arrestin homolog n=1 Tax=Penaeus chinensis TaxID=139456 RepID=UPI001FB6D571|nr:arrestin homolog [Penaeus chinensis]